MKARLIIADDHPLICQGLTDTIQDDPSLSVIATAHDGGEAEHLARTLAADLLILDIALPVKSGIKVLESLRNDGVVVPVLFFSMYPAVQYVAHARRAGAQGFLGKDADGESVVAAIHRVLSGRTSFPAQSVPRAGPATRRPARDVALSAREKEIMDCLLQGTSLVTIAAELGISPRSVSTYRTRLLEKMGVSNNAELISLMARPD